jgi:hypothetical protein
VRSSWPASAIATIGAWVWGFLLGACVAIDAPVTAPVPPPDPPALTEWHEEPVHSRAWVRNVLVLNHADPSINVETIAWKLQDQYDWLADWIGLAPDWVIVHVGANYPLGFATPHQPHPEMFLQAQHIFDSQVNYAHEMLHCFHGALARFPHWFEESMADAAFVESEIGLWKRRLEDPFLDQYDRVDHRSYELLRLRARYGEDLFPRMYAALRARLGDVRETMAEGSLEERNRLLLALLSDAAGEDLLPYFREEFGFDIRTRERQR